MEIDNDIDYEDILDNLDDYEYPYNHINRNNCMYNINAHARTRTHTGYIKINI